MHRSLARSKTRSESTRTGVIECGKNLGVESASIVYVFIEKGWFIFQSLKMEWRVTLWSISGCMVYKEQISSRITWSCLISLVLVYPTFALNSLSIKEPFSPPLLTTHHVWFALVSLVAVRSMKYLLYQGSHGLAGLFVPPSHPLPHSFVFHKEAQVFHFCKDLHQGSHGLAALTPFVSSSCSLVQHAR